MAEAGEDEGEYPSHLDVAWVAIDRLGRIGVFTTGGQGPIPSVYLRGDETTLDRLHSAIGDLAVASDYELFANVPRPDDFIDWARRGLFSFDWTDVHRTRDFVRVYEIQARPNAPALLSTARLAPDLRSFLGSVTSEMLDFDSSTIEITKALECAAQPAVADGRGPRLRSEPRR